MPPVNPFILMQQNTTIFLQRNKSIQYFYYKEEIEMKMVLGIGLVVVIAFVAFYGGLFLTAGWF